MLCGVRTTGVRRDLGDLTTVRFVRFVRPAAGDHLAEVEYLGRAVRWPLPQLLKFLPRVENAPTEAAIRKLMAAAPSETKRAEERAWVARQQKLSAESNAKADAQAAAIQGASYWDDLAARWNETIGGTLGITADNFATGAKLAGGVVLFFIGAKALSALRGGR